MAEEALKKLEEQLNCSICLDTYINPKQLQCNHIYCYKCLVRLVIRDQQGQLSLICPTCRQVTPIPPTGVAGLQSAFHINHLLEIQESFKKIHPPVTQEVGVGGATCPEPVKTVSNYCFVHDDKELELYCETCGELICFKCAIKCGNHYSHDYELLDKAFEKYKEEITSSVEPMEEQLITINKALSQLDTRCREISDQRAAIEANIHDNFRRLQEILDLRKTELVSKLHKITQRKLKGLAAQRDQIEISQVQLSSCLEFIKESLKAGNHGKVLKMKTTIVKQVEDLTTTFQLDVPNTEADMTFSASADSTTLCQSHGQVSTLCSPNPSLCYINIKDIEVAEVGEKCTTVLHTINFKRMQSQEPIMSPECELVSELTSTRVRGGIERTGQNQYKITYQPTMKGRHQLHVKIEGQHIRGSPFSVAIKLPVEKLGTPILTLGLLVSPRGIAVNQRGEVVVTEKDGHCISTFSPTGKKLQSFGVHGSGHGQLNGPDGVAAGEEGTLLVTDCSNHRIQKFTSEGQFLAAVGIKGSGPLQFCYPHGIVFNPNKSKVYVVDANNRVQVLNSDLTFSFIFGEKGSGKGQFNTPWGVACDSTGKVYVSDRNHRIQVFTAEGKFVRMFGMCDVNFPAGIAIDASGLVYVSEGGSHRISLFTTEGHFITSFGMFGEGLGEFNDPYGLMVDSSGVVYVCDCYNDRVQMF